MAKEDFDAPLFGVDVTSLEDLTPELYERLRLSALQRTKHARNLDLVARYRAAYDQHVEALRAQHRLLVLRWTRPLTAAEEAESTTLAHVIDEGGERLERVLEEVGAFLREVATGEGGRGMSGDA